MISQQASANTTKSCLGAIVICNVKMDQRWILVILVFHQKIMSGAGEDKIVKEGDMVEIHCLPSELGSMVVWFRVLDSSGIQFIASFSNNGIQKSATNSISTIFKATKITQNVLILPSFNKIRDSGVYSCAALYRGTELKFGTVTRLLGEKAKAVQLITTKATTIRQSPCTTAAPCVCNNKYNKKEETSPSLFCTPIILGPLVGTCGLLLLLLIVITTYCNHVRTRRCPHHYKRKPRATAAGKQMTTGRHV